jgi:hypothetical protein
MLSYPGTIYCHDLSPGQTQVTTVNAPQVAEHAHPLLFNQHPLPAAAASSSTQAQCCCILNLMLLLHVSPVAEHAQPTPFQPAAAASSSTHSPQQPQCWLTLVMLACCRHQTQ